MAEVRFHQALYAAEAALITRLLLFGGEMETNPNSDTFLMVFHSSSGCMCDKEGSCAC